MKFSFKDNGNISSNLYNTSAGKHFGCRCRALKCTFINWIRHSYILPYKNAWPGYIRSVCSSCLSLELKSWAKWFFHPSFFFFPKSPRTFTCPVCDRDFFLPHSSGFSLPSSHFFCDRVPLDFSPSTCSSFLLFFFIFFHLHTSILFTGSPITHAFHSYFHVCRTPIFLPVFPIAPPTPVFSCVCSCIAVFLKNRKATSQAFERLTLPYERRIPLLSYCCSFNYMNKTCHIGTWLNRSSN
jgi:hypothetical protein